MLRLLCLLIVGISVSGCVSSETMKKLAEKRQAAIEAAKLPPVTLNEQQTAKLKELAPKAHIVWLGAGRQKDGRVFVCHVVRGNDIFGKSHIALFSGTFEADGSYRRSWAYLSSAQAVVEDCRAHGFDPPVFIRTNYSVIRI